MTTELPLGGKERYSKPVSFHHGLMDLCTCANGTLLTFPLSPALCVCGAWSANKPVCERDYLGDTTTITFHLFCACAQFINPCTVSPLRPSRVRSPATVSEKIHRPGFYVAAVCVCSRTKKEAEKSGVNGAQINSRQTDLIHFLIIACR